MHAESMQGAGAVVLLAAAWMFDGAASAAEDVGLISSVDRDVAAWQPTSDERRMDRIAWVADIRAALRWGKELKRPIFVFTHDGSMATGRQ